MKTRLTRAPQSSLSCPAEARLSKCSAWSADGARRARALRRLQHLHRRHTEEEHHRPPQSGLQ